MGDLKKKNLTEKKEVQEDEDQIIERLRCYIQKFYEIQEEKIEQEKQEKEES